MSPAIKEYYNQIPVHIKEGYMRVVTNMHTMPAKKAKMTFDFAVKIWKPIVLALKTDFDKHKQTRTLPPNMTFMEYFAQFQQTADREFRKTHGKKNVAKHPQPRKQKKNHNRLNRAKRK